MKIQLPDGKQEDEPSSEHTTLVCEELKTSGNTGINKLICCSLFGMMYALAVITVDDAMRNDFLRRHYLDTTPYTLRMMMGCVMLNICMCGAMSVLIQKPMTTVKFVSVMLVAEVLRLSLYSWDFFSFLTYGTHYQIKLSLTVLSIRAGLEITLAVIFYNKVVAPARAKAAAAAAALATPPEPAAPSLSVEISGAQPSEIPSLPPGSIAHV